MTAIHHKKRHGHHKKHTDSFRRVYWPYIPMLVMLLVVLLMGSVHPRQLGRVLAAQSNVDHLGLLSATNEQRERQNADPLTQNQLLNQAAQAKAEDMKTRNYWSHETPDGQEPWVFVQETDYTYQRAGENLAYGFTTNSSTVGGWMQSQSHRENMLDPAYTEVGFGITQADNYLGGGPETIVVAFYATPGTEDSPVVREAGTLSTPPNERTPISVFANTAGLGNQWINLAAGITTGLAAGFLIARHGLRLKRIMRSGEHFVMHHPVLDLSLTAIIILGVLLLQSVGFVG